MAQKHYPLINCARLIYIFLHSKVFVYYKDLLYLYCYYKNLCQQIEREMKLSENQKQGSEWHAAMEK